jgi:hypothetical protein
MEAILKDRRLARNLNNYFINKLKYTYITERELLIVTRDDIFYKITHFNEDMIGVEVFNEEKSPLLAFSENELEIKSTIDTMICKELCHKNVIDFAHGFNHVIAITHDKNVFYWGGNSFGQFGNGSQAPPEPEYFEPELNDKLSTLKLVQICCGGYYSLGLSIDGDVYAWGKNDCGQIGNGKNGYMECQLEPYKLNGFDSNVKSIACGCELSMAQTMNDSIYVWGYEYSNLPMRIEIDANIVQMCCGLYHCLLLSNDGDIYSFGDNNNGQLGYKDDFIQLLPIKSQFQIKFKKVATHSLHDISVGESEQGDFYIWGKCGNEKIYAPKLISEISFDNIFIKYCHITYKVIEGEFNFNLEDNFIMNEKYSSNFTELFKIGSGAYGIVFKVKMNNGLEVAVKKMNFVMNLNSKIRKEYEIFLSITKLRSDLIVEYRDTWFEDYIENSNKTLRMYICMDCCQTNLKFIIEEIKSDPSLCCGGLLTPICYFIACQLFIELLESLDFLHKHNIIHRDLKPDNILLKNMKNRFIKIGDFGLASFQEFNKSHNANKGTDRYIAPEVISYRDSNEKAIYDTKVYDTKVDVYSLGVVFEDLFLNDINE